MIGNNVQVRAITAVSAVLFLGFVLSYVHAEHGDQTIAPYYWSMDSSDGHLGELICNDDETECDIPFSILLTTNESITNIPGSMTGSQIVEEIKKAVNTINGITTTIGFAERPPTATHDNVIRSERYNLVPELRGVYKYRYHCDGIIYDDNDEHGVPVSVSCFGIYQDLHLNRMEIHINSASNRPFSTTESCNGDSFSSLDLEKTLKHEFYHVLGFDHSGESESIVHEGYTCGSVGYEPTGHDTFAVQTKYPPLRSLHEDFEHFPNRYFNDTSIWTKSGTQNWETIDGLPPNTVPDHQENRIARAADCDADCILTSDAIDTSGYANPELSFWRFVDDSIDSGEYLKVKVSGDGGATWTEIFSWTDGSGDDDTWHQETVDLNPYKSDRFKVRFVAKTSSSFEELEIDDVVIRESSSGDNCMPPASGDWEITQDCTMAATAVAPAGVIIRAPAVLTIPAGVVLDVNFTGHGILIKDGAGMLMMNRSGIK